MLWTQINGCENYWIKVAGQNIDCQKNCGLSQSTLANIFKRNNIPSIKTLESICDGFGITLAQFFSGGEMVELTPELKEIFERWIILTPDQKDALLSMLRAFHEGK